MSHYTDKYFILFEAGHYADNSSFKWQKDIEKLQWQTVLFADT